jgi:hypothetical protein
VTAAHEAANRMCPECGHHTSACLAGRCTAFVAAPAGDPLGRLAVYCNCDCVKAITGTSLAGIFAVRTTEAGGPP